MQNPKLALALAPASLLLAIPAQAMPGTIAELREIIATEYAGNANAYAEEERGDFRVMGCRNRTDLIQALLDEGLILDQLSYRTHWAAFYCAFAQERVEAMELLITPDLVTAHEFAQYERPSARYFRDAINWDDYDRVRIFLENGVHAWGIREEYWGLTREEQLLLAAHQAINDRKEDAIRAFQDTGFGFLLDAARNEQNVRYVEERAGRSRGGGGGGLLGAIAGGVAGAYLGGSMGAGAGLLLGATEGGGEGNGNENNRASAGPLPLPTGRAKLGAVINFRPQPQGGMLIHDVLEDGPAHANGLIAGDVVTQIAGRPVNLRGSFYVALEEVVDLETFELTFRRDGTERSIEFDTSARASAVTEDDQTTADTGTPQGEAAGSEAEAVLAELERLADLRDRGILSEEEFDELKARILEGQ